jgi:methylmalonyl-CoA mutase N-terminal domain/subunit
MGFFQQRIAESAYELQKAIESGEVGIVGMNRYAAEEEPPRIELPEFADLEARQKRSVEAARRSRKEEAAKSALGVLGEAARGSGPLMPVIIGAVKSRATLGEICDVLRGAWGEYRA